MSNDVLRLFQPAVSRWFAETFSEPTPPQQLGWPRIAAGENTLILSPTGSGKTLAAFLCAIDSMIRTERDTDGIGGVHTLYLSPLKALANDIERNVDQPLQGIRASAAQMGDPYPEIRVGVRTGDTTAKARQQMVRRPPHLLITTPESLNLLLTSPKAREMLRTVRYVIVDEIHALCSSKRGTFLSLLLERLEALTRQSPTRIGLSATQRPLSEVAQFLGGFHANGTPRPVAIVDAGMRKSMDLAVSSPVEDMKALPQQDGRAPSIWPAIYDRLVELIDEHESTLIFANSRRVVEKIASELNQRFGYERVQAHHGSVSKERRHQIEQDLKEGRLPALVATSSMELGIDVGSIDLVCQVESPYSVSSGLQRIGRAGHLVRATSKGRVIPKTRSDLLMSAAMARAMTRGDISRVSIPRNPLDILAQQIVAMVAVDEWDEAALYERIRCAYPYRELTLEAFHAVLELMSGRFDTAHLPVLRARIAWDRVNSRLLPLPGTRSVAILNGGVIPDSGQYAMVLEDGKTRLGELDEEFVFERRIGDTFVLGTGQWRLLQVTHDRVIVAPCDESEAMMPFWKGEGLGHDWDFGIHYGEFVRACEDRMDASSLASWVQAECSLDESSAVNVVNFLHDQRARGGALPTDRRIVLDEFRNEAGEVRLAIMSTFGRSFHLALLLALQHRLREMNVELPEVVYSNAGLLFRLGSLSVSTMVQAIDSLSPDAVLEAITCELALSPYFALRFRRNAGRALLLPRARPGRRTPLWLQRLRAHDLLSYASQQPGFPIVLETYRELLEDVLPVDGLRQFLQQRDVGDSAFSLRRDRHPSPLSQAMLLDFTTRYLYLEDRPVGRNRSASDVHDDLAILLGTRVEAARVLDPAALQTVEERLQCTSTFHRARNGSELVEMLRRIGDLTEDEVSQRCARPVLDVLPDLLEDGRIVRIHIPGALHPDRLAAGEDALLYAEMSEQQLQTLVARYVAHHALRSRTQILEQYPAAEPLLDALREAQGWIDVESSDGTAGWAHPQVLASIRRLTMSQRRRRVEPVTAQRFSEFLLSLQHVTVPVSHQELDEVMIQLSGYALPMAVWIDVLSSRIRGFQPESLDALLREGRLTWSGNRSTGHRVVAFQSPGNLEHDRSRVPEELLEETSLAMVHYLRAHGACFLHQLAVGLNGSPSAIALCLWDLIWDGWVTNDSLDPAWGDQPQPDRWQGRRRQAVWGKGRWSLVLPAEKDSETRTRAMLHHLLAQVGVLTHETVERSSSGLRWRHVYPLLTRMEWAGEVDRALFVSGLSGPQFAYASTAQALITPVDEERMVLLNVSDPANVFGELFGVLRPDGERHIIRHHPGNYLVLDNGNPLIAVENRGERLTPLDDLVPTQRASALKTLIQLVEGRHRPSSVRVRTWDGAPVVDSPIEDDLAAIGFRREGSEMIYYRTYS